jgi:branched-chain amino acid aminotransferase
MLDLTFDPVVDLTRTGARHGHGCFETIRVQAGEARWLALHLERLAAGCAFLGLDAPPASDALAVQLAPALGRQGEGVLHLVAVDDRLVAAVSPLPPGPALPVRIGVAEAVTRFSRSPTARFKTLSYLENRLLQREAERRGLFDVIALNERGRLADGGRTNLFLVVNGGVVTPPAADGALPGIARRVLLERGLAVEESLSPAALEAAEGVFVASALRGVLAVRVDGGGRVEECAGVLRSSPAREDVPDAHEPGPRDSPG